MNQSRGKLKCRDRYLVLVDVRGYSGFCRKAEVPEIEAFVNRSFSVFDHFLAPYLQYRKCTGDGLLGIIDPDKDLYEATEYLVLAAYILAEYFPQIVSGIHDAPVDLAFAFTRGYILEGPVFGQLDFFGPAVNVAAKVCASVRPAGCFIHESLPLKLIPKELVDQLEPSTVLVESHGEKWEERGFKYIPTRYRQQRELEPLKVTPYNLDKSGVKILLDGSNLSSLPNFHITADQVRDPSVDWFAFMIWVRLGAKVPGTTPVLIPWRNARAVVRSPTIADTVGSLNIEALIKIVRKRFQGWIEEIEILHSKQN